MYIYIYRFYCISLGFLCIYFRHIYSLLHVYVYSEYSIYILFSVCAAVPLSLSLSKVNTFYSEIHF
jgi:hypothetical protein